MNPTLLVAAREVRERTRRRSFWAVLLLSALAVVAVVIVPQLTGGPDRLAAAVTRGERSPVARAALEAAGRGAEVRVRVRTVSTDAELERLVRSERVEVGVDGDGRVVVRTTPTDSDTGAASRVARSTREILRVQAGLAAAGLDPTEAAAALGAPAPSIRALEPTDPEQAGRQGTALVANILLFLLLQVYGTWVLTGVTEEKSSRVVEVLLAAVSPRAVLDGKLLGIGAVALLHGAVLTLSGVIAGLVTGASFLDQVDAAALPAALGWLVLGYAFYCCVYGAAGATVSRVEDAQGLAFPILLPVLVAYVMGFGVVFSDSVPVLYHVLAWLPPTAPVAMAVLQLSGRVPWWEGVGSMVVTALGVAAMSRVAARIYQGSILRTGARVSLRSALRTGRVGG